MAVSFVASKGFGMYDLSVATQAVGGRVVAAAIPLFMSVHTGTSSIR